MTLTLLKSAAKKDNPFAPVTPVRLGFLLRKALADVSPTAVSQPAIYNEVWERRDELADRVTTTLQTYREDAAEVDDQLRVWRFAEALGRVVVVTAALMLFSVAGSVASSILDHSRISSGLELGAAAAGLDLILGVAVGRVAGKGGRRHGEMYQRLIAGELKTMVRQIIQRDDERARGGLLHPMQAPRLVEFGSSAVVRSESFEDVLGLVSGHVTSAVGVAGARGAGKTTLLRLLCDTGADARRPEWIGVYLPAPMSSAEGQFVRVIYSNTVKKVIASRNLTLTEGGRLARRRKTDRDIAWAQEALDRITGTRSRQRTRKAALSRWGMSAERAAQTTWTEREPSRADWVAEFRGYAEEHRRRRGAPIIIAIDEIDKVADAEQAIEIINGIKDLFHVEGVHFVVSISDDALRRFAARGIPVRDTFDTAFDAVIEVRRLSAQKSYELLRQRVPRFPYSAALFCHAWSGGLARDLIRTARSCIAIQSRSKGPVAVAELVHAIIRRDVSEVVDAAIRREQDNRSGAVIEALLTLRRLTENDEAPPHRQLAARDLSAIPDPGADADLLLSSLGTFLDIAVTMSEYYSITRDSEQSVKGIDSGEFLRHADLLAQAKAALGIHPREAAWRLTRARQHIGP